MSGMLAEIVAFKQAEVEERKGATPLNTFLRHISPAKGDFVTALSGSGINIVAEVKPASPSAGTLRQSENLDEVIPAYNKLASAISVLTDERYFKGSLALLSTVAKSSSLPVLCKDFILDSYQLYEARLAGAEAALLIVKVLNAQQLKELFTVCTELGMTAVVEVQTEEEVAQALAINPRCVLINNRDLNTLEIDLNTCLKLAPLLPDGTIAIAASGIETAADIRMLSGSFNSFLVGSALMKSNDIEAKLRELITADGAA